MKRVLPIFAILAILSSCAAIGGGAPAESARRYFFFDGASFVEGRRDGSPAVMVIDGYYPEIVAGNSEGRPRRLPEGAGAVAGFCYMQVAGGKLGGADGAIPLAGRDVSLTGEGRKVTVRTDEKGYFVAALPEGSYDIELSGVKKRIGVKKGKSTVVTLRGGKRLVD